MRLREQRRLAKQLRLSRLYKFELECVQAELRKGLSFRDALLAVIRDRTQQHASGRLAKLMAEHGDRSGVDAAIERFFASQGHLEIYTSALILEETKDRRVRDVLHRVLDNDSDPDRRHGAARALGWMYPCTVTRAIDASLARFLRDTTQTPDARADAAESLKYGKGDEGTAALIAATRDENIVVRFFAAFALGSRKATPEVIYALEQLLPDQEELNSYWSVSKEALAMLGQFRPFLDPYHALLKAECSRVRQDKTASESDRRWAKFYGT